MDLCNLVVSSWAHGVSFNAFVQAQHPTNWARAYSWLVVNERVMSSWNGQKKRKSQQQTGNSLKMRTQKSFGFASGCRWKQCAMEKSADEMKYSRKILERLHRDLEDKDYTNLLCKIFAGKISRIRCTLKLKLNMIRERWTEQCVAWEHEHDMISSNWTKYILPFHPLRCLYRGIWTGCAVVFMKTRILTPFALCTKILTILCVLYSQTNGKYNHPRASVK